MEEMFDTYNEEGEFLSVKPRSECHKKSPGFFHKTVWILIINSKKQILAQKRAKTKGLYPGKWDTPAAGHIQSGESVLQACVRETHEELGLDVKSEDFVFLREWKMEDLWEFAQIFLLKTDAKENEMTLQIEEVEEVKWFSYDDFVKLIYSNDFCPHDIKYKDWVCEYLKNI